MIEWVAFGFDPEAFWRQTPRSIEQCFKGKASAMKVDHKTRAWHTWTNAALSRIPVHVAFPKFESLLPSYKSDTLSTVISTMKTIGKNLPKPKPRKV